jgi:hypothetical protein
MCCAGLNCFSLNPPQTDAVCGTVSGSCYCWIYAGQNAGQVQKQSGSCTFGCGNGGPSWN